MTTWRDVIAGVARSTADDDHGLGYMQATEAAAAYMRREMIYRTAESAPLSELVGSALEESAPSWWWSDAHRAGYEAGCAAVLDALRALERPGAR